MQCYVVPLYLGACSSFVGVDIVVEVGSCCIVAYVGAGRRRSAAEEGAARGGGGCSTYIFRS